MQHGIRVDCDGVGYEEEEIKYLRLPYTSTLTQQLSLSALYIINYLYSSLYLASWLVSNLLLVCYFFSLLLAMFLGPISKSHFVNLFIHLISRSRLLLVALSSFLSLFCKYFYRHRAIRQRFCQVY